MKNHLNTATRAEIIENRLDLQEIVHKKPKSKYSNKQKALLTIRAFAVFFSEIGLSAKNVVRAICFSALILFILIIFWHGFIRALDIAAYENEKVMIDYKASLNNDGKDKAISGIDTRKTDKE